MTRLSWLAPILVLWLLGRLASLIVITWIGPDIGTSIAAEKAIFEDWLNIGSVPENSFLDLLTALAVMPLSAFTTLTVLGGGGKPLPEWLLLESEDSWKTPEGEDENGNILNQGIDVAAGTAAGVGVVAGGAMLAGQSLGNLVSSGGSEGEALDLEPGGGDGTGGSEGFAENSGDSGAGIGSASEDGLGTDMNMSMFDRFD